MSGYVTNVINYLRIPVIASSGVALVLSGLLYFKQKSVLYRTLVILLSTVVLNYATNSTYHKASFIAIRHMNIVRIND